jgi:hypothetical protein
VSGIREIKSLDHHDGVYSPNCSEPDGTIIATGTISGRNQTLESSGKLLHIPSLPMKKIFVDSPLAPMERY